MHDEDELPIFRPKIGNRRVAPARGTKSFRNAILASSSGLRSTSKAGTRPRSRVAIRAAAAVSRRVVVKARVVRMGAYGKAAAALHLRYLVRDGVERDGSPGQLYGAEGPARASDFEAERAGEPHQFRLILSPEDGADLDLTAYAQSYMARVEKDLGRPLEWAAVNHYNTDNPHVHLLIRGVDLRGEPFRLDRTYVAQGLRARAQELATDELGPRLAIDLERQLDREVTHNRFTSLDRDLARRAPDLEMQFASAARGNHDSRQARRDARLVGRLQHLERLHLAQRQAPHVWVLASGWQQSLKALGERGDILKQMHHALRGEPSRYQILKSGPEGIDRSRPLYGRVAAKGLADELKGDFYAVIEAPAGGGYHVPLDRRAADALRVGDLVDLKWAERKPVSIQDRELFARAKANGMIIQTDPSTPYGAPPGPTPVSAPRASELKRIQELERLGLATPVGNSRWRLDARLLESLSSQAPTRAGRLIVQPDPLSLTAQVEYPGPVALDRLRGQPLARSGLGSEIARALSQRNEFLQARGLALRGPGFLDGLRALELRTLGQQRAAKTGRSFLEKPPEGFEGRVVLLERAPNGSRWVEISQAARFALVPSNPVLRAREGQVIALSRDRQGWRASPGRDRAGG